MSLCQVKTNKGVICGRCPKENSEYCGYHKNHNKAKAKETVYQINEHLKQLVYHNHANNEKCESNCPKFKEFNIK